MASLRVPERYVGGLAKLLSLSDEEFERVLILFEQMSISNKPRKAIKDAVAGTTVIASNDAESIADAVMSLFSIFNYQFKPASEGAREVAEAIEESSSEEIKRLSDDIRGKAQSRLVKLFSVSTLALSIKAEARRFDYDKIFAYARISSDIRPIFSDNAKELPQIAVVNHMMNIHYIHEGNHQDFYVVLDDVDLKELKEQLERATLKSENLQAFLKANKIDSLSPE